ncbi:DUF3152 domain-containing protein [Streptomyces phytophilus]|uniref:DUF3152 domain-containing protein n=1 Tax=Streptomyces phytophilus TaxID=722715 RepID=UPI0015F08431|nr:DUF3152 domain-containing protein [Streptomyces phytophilus]
MAGRTRTPVRIAAGAVALALLGAAGVAVWLLALPQSLLPDALRTHAPQGAADDAKPPPLQVQQHASGFHVPYRAPASGLPHSSGFAVGGSVDMPALGDLMYRRRMGETYPIPAELEGAGTFETVPGRDPAPGEGRVVRYRVDIEDDVPLDGRLFARAVQETLNDPRSWGEPGRRTFERVSTGPADFAVTLASPGTTGEWCAMSGFDTTVDNVSCDSGLTERVLINAFRWAQGSTTYGDDILGYRQMLINHEVGHRLGHLHAHCVRDGARAPVMMQQTLSLTTDGARCETNPWPYPDRD